jgi:hypothetical protein
MLPYKFSDLTVYSFGFYTISKKNFFQNFQKIELRTPVKGSKVIFEQKYFGTPTIITQKLSKKKKKVEIFTIVFFLTDS